MQEANIPFDFLEKLQNNTRAMSGFFDLDDSERTELLAMLQDEEDEDRAAEWLSRRSEF